MMRTANFILKSTIVNLERNHVVFVAILFSCQGTDVRERAAILPDPHVRVKRITFISMKPIRLTRTRLLLSRCCWKDLRARTAFAACRDRGVYVPAASLSTTASWIVNCVTPLTIPCRGIVDNLSAPVAIPASLAAQPAVQIRVIACFPKIPYRSGTSRNDPTPTPIPPISVRRPPARNGPRPWPCRGRNRTTLPAVAAGPHR
jgi:hypothetical protein